MSNRCPKCGSSLIVQLLIYRYDGSTKYECQECEHAWLSPMERTTSFLEEIIMPDGLNEFIPVLNKQSTYISETGYIDTLKAMLSENDEHKEQSK